MVALWVNWLLKIQSNYTGGFESSQLAVVCLRNGWFKCEFGLGRNIEIQNLEISKGKNIYKVDCVE